MKFLLLLLSLNCLGLETRPLYRSETTGSPTVLSPTDTLLTGSLKVTNTLTVSGQISTPLLYVNGVSITGLGTDANTLDGLDSLQFMRSDFATSSQSISTTGNLTVSGTISSGSTIYSNGNQVLTSASLVDAATFDGLDSTVFLRNDQSGTIAGNLQVSSYVSSPIVYSGGFQTLTTNSTLNASTLNSQTGSYYLDRTNHTGQQLASTISDFDEASQDSVGGILTNSSDITFTYSDGTPSITAGFANRNVSQFTNDSGYLTTTPTYTTSYPLSVTSNNYSLLYNTNNLKITANELNTIQDIGVSSSPTFSVLTATNSISSPLLSSTNLSVTNNITANNILINGSQAISRTGGDSLYFNVSGDTVSGVLTAANGISITSGNLTVAGNATASNLYASSSVSAPNIYVGGSSAISQTGADARYLKLSGGSISGTLTVSGEISAANIYSNGVLLTAGGGGGGGSSAYDPVEALLVNGEIANSAYLSGLTSSNNTTSTAEGYLIESMTAGNLRAIAEYNTNLYFPVTGVTLNTSIRVSNDANNTGEIPSGTVLKIYRPYTIDSTSKYLDTGSTITTSSAASASYPRADFYTSATNGLTAGDYLVRDTQLVNQVSLVAAGASDSYSNLTRDTLDVTATGVGGFLSGTTHQWAVENSDLSKFEDQIGSLHIAVTNGPLTTTTGHHYPHAVNNLSTGQAWTAIASASGSDGVAINNTTPFSVSWWAYLTAVNGAKRNPMVGQFETASGVSNGWAVWEDGNSFYLLLGGTSNIAFVNGATNNTWYHFVYTQDGGGSSSVGKVYINNVLKYTSSPSNPQMTGKKPIFGGKGAANDDNFTGYLHDIQYINNRVITTTEIAELYNSGLGKVMASSITVRERLDASSMTGQVLKNRVSVPNFSSGGIITLSKHGVIKN